MIRFCPIIGLLAACAVILFFNNNSYAQAGAGNWRAQIGTFRVGVVSTRSGKYELARLQPFRDVLRKALGMSVEITLFESFNGLIEAQMESRIEYAIYSASAFATIWSRCKCVQPLVSPAALDGARGFRSVLLANKEEVASVAEMKGKIVLLPGRHSFAGYLFPKEQLAQSNIDIENTDWKVANRGSMESALTELLLGQGTAIFGWEPFYADERPLKPSNQGTAALLMNEARRFVPIWRSQPVYFGPHVVRADLDERAKVLLWEILIVLDGSNPKAYDAISPLQGGGFHRVTRSAYQPVIRFVSNHVDPELKLLPNKTVTK